MKKILQKCIQQERKIKQMTDEKRTEQNEIDMKWNEIIVAM